MSFFKKKFYSRDGLTLIEILLVMGLTVVLFSFVTLNLTDLIPQTNFSTTVETLTADIKQQQLKAMANDTEGRTDSSPYGIYFTANAYILFHGLAYNPAEASNITISINDSLTLEGINFPNSTIIFDQGSGEINGFAGSAYSLTLRDPSHARSQVINLNRYGVISLE